MATKAPVSCACGSGLAYEECCAPFHQGRAEPIAADVLMRSRFSAFCLGEVEWLWTSLHPDHDDRAQPREAGILSLRHNLSRGLLYKQLTILDHRPPDAEGIAQVLFLVVLKQRGRDLSFVELSSFAHDGSGIRYLLGVLRPLSAIQGDVRALRIAQFIATYSDAVPSDRSV